MRYDMHFNGLVIATWATAGDVDQARLGGLVPDGATIVAVASADDVRAEAQRRIIALTGARSLEHCMLQQLNALTRATELTNKRALGIELSPAEATEAASLEQLAADIKAIRAASNAMEPDPPADYMADGRWVSGQPT